MNWLFNKAKSTDLIVICVNAGVAGHCQTFEGVRCGELNEVVSINLPELDKRGLQATGVQITEVLQIISNFESLQVGTRVCETICWLFLCTTPA